MLKASFTFIEIVPPLRSGRAFPAIFYRTEASGHITVESSMGMRTGSVCSWSKQLELHALVRRACAPCSPAGKWGNRPAIRSRDAAAAAPELTPQLELHGLAFAEQIGRAAEVIALGRGCSGCGSTAAASGEVQDVRL